MKSNPVAILQENVKTIQKPLQVSPQTHPPMNQSSTVKVQPTLKR